jgi:3D (Asp-Asp-Asp) domain-containing protein
VLTTVTGYANGSDGGAVGTTTASGTKTHWGTVAADWRLLPLGTRLQIEGFDGVTFSVEDSGSGVHGLIVDIWFPDVPTAQAFGTQHRKVTILP